LSVKQAGVQGFGCLWVAWPLLLSFAGISKFLAPSVARAAVATAQPSVGVSFDSA